MYLLMTAIWFHCAFRWFQFITSCVFCQIFSVSCLTNNYRANLLNSICQHHTWPGAKRCSAEKCPNSLYADDTAGSKILKISATLIT